MKRLAALFGVVGACAVCCAVPLAAPLLLGIGGGSLAATGNWVGVLLGVAAGAAALAILVVRRQRAVRAAKAGACECDSSCTVPKGCAS